MIVLYLFLAFAIPLIVALSYSLLNEFNKNLSWNSPKSEDSVNPDKTYAVEKEDFPQLPPYSSKNYIVKTIQNKDYYQIQALRDIPEHQVKRGDLGGFVSGEKNLSHEGNGWIGVEAKVLDDSVVLDGLVIGDSTLTGRVIVKNSTVKHCVLNGSVQIENNSSIENTTMYSNEEDVSFQISASVVKGCHFYNRDVESSEIYSSTVSNSYFYKKVNLYGAMLKVNTACFRDRAYLEDSYMDCDLVEVSGYIHLYNSQLIASVFKTLGFFTATTRSIEEEPSEKVQPIAINGGRLEFENIQMNGNISLLVSDSLLAKNTFFNNQVTMSIKDGEISNSLFQDYAKVDMNLAAIRDCQWGGFSIVQQKEKAYRTFVGLILEDDDEVVFEEVSA